MNRSAFLKTIGTGIAAALVPWRSESVENSAPNKLARKVSATLALPDILTGDVLSAILSDGRLLEFARDGIEQGRHPVVGRPFGLSHMALESDAMELGQPIDQMAAASFLENVRFVLEDAVRSVASVRHPAGEVYHDHFPVKLANDGFRISPFISVATTYGERLECNPRYDEAPIVLGIQKPLRRPVMFVTMEIAPKVIESEPGDGWKPAYWVVRAVLCRAVRLPALASL